MDELQALERRVAGEVVGEIGPSEPVDDLAIFDAIVAATPPRRWRLQPVIGVAKFVVAGALVVLFGGVLLIAQPFGQEGGSVPGAVTDVEVASPVEFTATIDYGRRVDAEGLRFPVVASDPRVEGTLIWNSTRKTYPGVDIELEAVSVRIENEGGAWEERVGVQLANLSDDESPDVEPPLDRRSEPESDAVTYVGVDGYEGLFIVAESTWDVMTLETDLHGYIFEGELPVALEP